MAHSNPELIEALRETAERLQQGARYEWGHMGRCNCGHLVQTLTAMSDVEIVRSIDYQMNEWTEHAREYCTGGGAKIDDLFLTLQRLGFGHNDIINLEYLSDRRVLRRVGREQALRHNDREDVCIYMNTMADMLEEETSPV